MMDMDTPKKTPAPEPVLDPIEPEAEADEPDDESEEPDPDEAVDLDAVAW